MVVREVKLRRAEERGAMEDVIAIRSTPGGPIGREGGCRMSAEGPVERSVEKDWT